MRRFFSRVMAVMVLWLPGLGAAQAADVLTDAQAVNYAGSLRYLSQRAMKNYLAVGAGIRPDQAHRQLDESVADFEQNLQALLVYAKDSELQKSLHQIEALWQQQRQLLLAAPQKEQARRLLQDNNRLLLLCEQTTQAIGDATNRREALLINTAGRQRMLSQKIAKAYFALYWQVADEQLEGEFEQAVQQFSLAMKQLKNSPDNSEPIRQALNKVDSQWNFSRTGFALNKDGRYVPTVISVTTESILWKMDAITHDYEQLMASLRH